MKERTHYVPLSATAAEALAQTDACDFELYLPGANGKEPVLYRKAGDGVAAPDFERVRARGVPYLFVRDGDLERIGGSLESRLAELLSRADLAPQDKAQLGHKAGVSVATSLINDPRVEGSCDRAARVVDNMIDGLLHDPAAGAYLIQMAEHDRSTAGHMYMVSMLAVLLGSEVFGPDREVLRALGLAGMLHDIGKLAVDPAILQKTGPLTQDEVLLLQQHPIESVRLIGSDPNVTPDMKQMIIQHHERLDGLGYPLGVGEEDLLDGSKVLSIVDSFHAMIGMRSYRDPLTADDANRLLEKQSGRQFAPEYLACWFDLCERSTEFIEAESLIAPPPGGSDTSSRHEHLKNPSPPKNVGSRQVRYVCRKDSRVRCIYAGRLSGVSAADNEFLASVHDVSRSGLCIRSPHPMFRGEVLHVRIDAQPAPVWVKATVAWCRQHEPEQYRAGLHLHYRIEADDVFSEASVRGLAGDEGHRLAK